jgi:hypothetical protein
VDAIGKPVRLGNVRLPTTIREAEEVERLARRRC